MKKLFARALLFTLIACTLLLTLTACGPMPEFDVQVAAANLEANGYTVKISTEENSIGVVKTLHAQLEVGDTFEQIQITEFETTKLAKIEYREMKLELESEIEDIELRIEKAEHILDEYGDELDIDKYEKYTKNVTKYENQLSLYKKFSCGRFGKVVWGGSQNAIKATKQS